MKKIRLIIVLFFALMMNAANAQTGIVNHTLKQGETLSALAKEYQTNVGDIMRANNMHADTKLVYGSVIKIPSSKKINTMLPTPKPVVQQSASLPANALKHAVVKGETLFSISKAYHTSAAQLQSWNHLTDNSVKTGSILIVGQDDNTPVSTQTPPETKQSAESTTVNNATVSSTQTSETAATVTPTQTDSITNSNNIQTEPANQPAATTLTNNGNGFFEDAFTKSRHQQHITGISKTFKTASGWSDGKYYILADNITPGTIVKLTADNGKNVYAKVLWNMSDLKENTGINFRVSDATAAAMNENTDAFNINVTY